MKFENPIMNISMFEVENVVTGSSQGGDTPGTTAETGSEKAIAALKDAGVTNTVKVTF